MSAYGVDPELASEFLTESGELIEQLDADLVTLETDPDTPGLLDQIFRALHTIKGAASFLNLTELIEFAHAAEDALNTLRKGEAEVDQGVIDAMLRSVDVLRGQLDELAQDIQMTPGPTDLIEQLKAISSGKGEGAGTDAGDTPAEPPGAADGANSVAPAAQADAPAGDTAGPLGSVRSELNLPPQKADLVPFMADDIADAGKSLREALASLGEESSREQGAAALVEMGDATAATADFFEFNSLTTLAQLFKAVGEHFGALEETHQKEIIVRLHAAGLLIDELAGAVAENTGLEWNLETYESRMRTLTEAGDIDWPCAHEDDANAVLDIDGVTASATEAQATAEIEPVPDAPAEPEPDTATPPQSPCEPLAETPAEAEAKPTPTPSNSAPSADKPDTEEKATKTGGGGGVEQTIRVEVSRLEELLNLVGEMVLTKNQVLGQARNMRDHNLPQDVIEQMQGLAGDLDRLTGELQVGVMRTRMQPLSKLFGRYPRIIRDLARKTGKNVNLEITGGETEVDKSVLELLGDPLVHMLRNSVDHGIEAPGDRAANAKPETGTIKLAAEHQGGHVRVSIVDDGKGMDRAIIGGKAVEKGIVTEDALAGMSDSEVFKFIFAAGFSTAAQVSDLSGRGVGMDVVRTNISKLGGQINVQSTLGRGTTFEILIPLTVAIMPAMMVGVGEHDYAIPLTCIHEIVRSDANTATSVAGRPAMRLRNEVLPLVSMPHRLGESENEILEGFAVVVGVGEEKAGLVVDRLVGQQEIVIKPLDDEYTTGGPFSGATIREDGEVCLILDIVGLLRDPTAASAAVA